MTNLNEMEKYYGWEFQREKAMTRRQSIFDFLWGIKWLAVFIALLWPLFSHNFNSYPFAFLVIGLSILGWRDKDERQK